VTSVTVLAVGRVRGAGLAAAIDDYENRLRHYFRYRSVEVPAARLPDARADEAMASEGESLLRKLPEEAELVALTRTGKRWSTRDLAKRIRDNQTYGGGSIAFAIGGAHGLGGAVLERAAHRVALSAMTLPHELARLVLTEQLYRAGTILRGEPYHKGP
jgi:23S rRNA (pseudouridine1915-N3)-methyltransferase